MKERMNELTCYLFSTILSQHMKNIYCIDKIFSRKMYKLITLDAVYADEPSVVWSGIIANPSFSSFCFAISDLNVAHFRGTADPNIK